MPPRNKIVAVESDPEVETAAAGVAPAHASDLCTKCGLHPLDPSTTVFACEHGTWVFFPEQTAQPPSEADRRAAWLASLSEEELLEALNSKTAPPAE